MPSHVHFDAQTYSNTIPFDRRPAIELPFAERCQLRNPYITFRGSTRLCADVSEMRYEFNL